MAANYNYNRIRPADLQQVLSDQGNGTTLADAITAIQTHLGVTFDCPKCKVNNVNTGWNTQKVGANSTMQVICTVCKGNMKTVQQYVADPNNAGNYVPLTINGQNSMPTNAQITFTASVAGGSWSSSDQTKATINANTGVVTAVAAGATNIIYTYGDYQVIQPLTVAVLAVNGTSPMAVNQTATFTSNVPGGTWASTQPSKATVGASTGVVTAIAAGVTVIQYNVDDTQATFELTVQ